MRDFVDQILTVSDDEILAAQRLLWERAKLLIETSSATALAIVLRPEFPQFDHPARIGIILSGGNVDLDNISWK